jgi:hypothetical protein
MCFFVPAKVKHFFRGNLAELIVLSVFELAKSLLKNIGYSKIAAPFLEYATKIK